ncbi:MAG: LysR family transcriptional regulator, partial [Rhizobiaceae bacterium]
MTVSSLDWDDLRFILAVAESGSAVAAAKKIGVNPSTIQRRIARFEEQNGIRLFERRRRGLHPTPECRNIVVEVSQINERVMAMSRDMLGGDLRLEGLLRVTSTETFLTQTVAEQFAEFRRIHPAIELEVTLTNTRLNLSRQDADIAIRPSRAPHETLVGQRIAGLGFALYGVEALVGDLPEVPDLKTLRNLPWIGAGEVLAAAPSHEWIANNIPHETVGLTIDTFPAMVTCALAGTGVALLPCSLADTQPALLRRELPGERLQTSVWILTHPEIRNAARIKAFMG